MNMSKGWIGVDLDGTLAHYDGWKGIEEIGPPVPAMLERVKRWIAEGHEVRIFTARCSDERAVPYINDWVLAHFGHYIDMTNVKDFGMIELWDDRAVQVRPNTGEPIGESTRGLT